ncbi:hypothetical protein KY285_016061 [Solanum tuberosum]|nr:hypothetical protein KY285_016061 [Solanum tuberosum]
MEDQKVLKVFVDDSICDSIKEMKDSISKDLAEFRSILLEALGENATTSFQPPNTVMGAKLWQFQSENLEVWIVQAEYYFDFYSIEEDRKLTVASFYLDGEHLIKSKELESVRGRFTNLGQVTYVNEYQYRCERHVFDEFSDKSRGAILESHRVRTMTRDTIETHFPTDPEYHVAPCDVANDCIVVTENKDKNKGETSLIIPIEDNVIVEFYPFLFSQPCFPLMSDDFGDLTLPNDFGDLTLCVSVKNGLTPFYWFDTGQHTSSPNAVWE